MADITRSQHDACCRFTSCPAQGNRGYCQIFFGNTAEYLFGTGLEIDTVPFGLSDVFSDGLYAGRVFRFAFQSGNGVRYIRIANATQCADGSTGKCQTVIGKNFDVIACRSVYGTP